MAFNQKANVDVTLNNEQAKRELEELQDKIKNLIALKKKAESEGDVTAYKKVSTELNKSQKAASAYQREIESVKAVLADMSGATLRQLQNALGTVNKQLMNTRRGTQEFQALKDAQKQLQAEIVSSTGKMTLQQTPLQRLMSMAKGLLPAFGWAAIGAGAVSAFNQIKNATDTLGTQWDIFIGGLKGGLNEFWRTMAAGDWSNFTGNMREAIKVGREYQDVLDQLDDKKRALSIAEADARKTALQLEDAVRNQTLTDKQRIAAAEQRIALEETLTTKRKKLAQQTFDNELMITVQQTRLSKERLLEVISDFDSETRAMAKSYNEKQQLIKDYEKQYSKITGTSTLNKDEQNEYSRLKKEVGETSEIIKLYAEAITGAGKTTDEQLDKLVSSYVALSDAEASTLENTRRVRTQMNSLLAKEEKDKIKTEKEVLKEIMSALDEAHQERLMKIEQHSIEERKSQEWVNLEKGLAERAYLEQKLAFMQQAGEQGIEIQRKLVERELELIRQADDRIKELRNSNIDEFHSWLAERNAQEEVSLTKSIDKNIEYGEEQIKNSEDLQKSEREQLAKRAEAIMEFTEGIGDSFQDFLTSQDMSFGEFLRDTLLQTLEFVEKMMIAAIAQTMIEAIMGGAPINVAAVARSAAKILLLKAAFGVAKAVIKGNQEKKEGYAEGGHTGSGNQHEVAGVVHKEEWVAPKWMVDSPTTGPIINALENIRKSKFSINTAGLNTLATQGYFFGGFAIPNPVLLKPAHDKLHKEMEIQKATNQNDPINPVFDQVNSNLDRNSQVLDKVNVTLDKLEKKKWVISVEQIQKGLQDLDEINRHRGL